MLALRVVLVWLMLFTLSASHGLAGPWPRGAGNGFVSSEFVLDRTAGMGRIAHRHYLEYGLSDQVTMGAALERQTGWEPARHLPPLSRLGAAPLRGNVFLRWHPGEITAQTPYALEIQLAHDPQRKADRLRLAAHLGHGFEVMGRGGWARLGASAGVAGHLHHGQRDISAQIGLRTAPGLRNWLDLDMTFASGDTIPRLSVSSAFDVTARVAVTLGYTRTLGDWRETGWRIGLWAEF